MKSRAPYTECRIYIDGVPGLDVGHYLYTAAGSGYRVQSMRQDGKRSYRRHLVCLRVPVAEIPADARSHEFYWYSRKKKSATTLAQMAARAPA